MKANRSRASRSQPTAVQRWLDAELGRDAEFRRQVEETLGRMRLEQDLAALRRRRNVSQRRLARILGVSQPAIARIESGRSANLEVRTLVRYAAALGGRVRIAIEPSNRERPRRRPRRREVPS